MDELAGWLRALALAVGGRPLAAYALGLAAVLAGSALAWWLLHRWLVPRSDSRLPPHVFLLTRIATGFVVIWLGAWAFAELAEQLGAGREAMATADLLLAEKVRDTVPKTLVPLIAAITHLADPLALSIAGVMITAVLWRSRHRILALAWAASLGGNALLNPALKQVFARTRPDHAHALVAAQGYSFPSGHSSGAVVAYGMLAYVLVRLLPVRWHLPLAMAAAGVAFTVGCSRVLLGVHYASDVLAGFASGAAWLAVCVTSVELLRHARRRPSAPAEARGSGA